LHLVAFALFVLYPLVALLHHARASAIVAAMLDAEIAGAAQHIEPASVDLDFNL
jgi:hypothetical protein